MLDVRSLAFWLLVRVSCGEVPDSLAVESVNALSFVTFDPGFAKRGRSLTSDLHGIPSALPLASPPLRNGPSFPRRRRVGNIGIPLFSPRLPPPLRGFLPPRPGQRRGPIRPFAGSAAPIAAEPPEDGNEYDRFSPLDSPDSEVDGSLETALRVMQFHRQSLKTHLMEVFLLTVIQNRSQDLQRFGFSRASRLKELDTLRRRGTTRERTPGLLSPESRTADEESTGDSHEETSEDEGNGFWMTDILDVAKDVMNWLGGFLDRADSTHPTEKSQCLKRALCDITRHPAAREASGRYLPTWGLLRNLTERWLLARNGLDCELLTEQCSRESRHYIPLPIVQTR
ncbi:unnamed protein product [Darwinula stevensoni]|uniref:Uncharacterized protein n=1 Tax=Darwinula stevensoni TaxID=69355 RepID=A0A7R9A6Y7_9CRUS|nr:unnamed protein product [Darwinula stevensoni]CAG0890772.1 unnamed protein product [Darwinula stevensoni]